MLDTIRQQVLDGARISPEQAAVLYNDADDALLRELASATRARFHPARRCTWLKMAIINTTNVCVARCDYCAFYRLPRHPESYLLSVDELCRRVESLIELGGTLVGFNGGFHPKLRIIDYAQMFAAVRQRFPDLEFYEMTVAEFLYSCKVSRLSYAEGARILADHGTRWVTGGGAEILTESFRMRHSPLKYSAATYYDAQRAILDAGLGSTATMVIGFDETLDERLEHLTVLRDFQDDVQGRLSSFLCWTYKPWNTDLGGQEIEDREYLRWLAIARIFLDNFRHIRTSVLTRNAGAMAGLLYGADDFDLPTEDEVTQSAGATISHDFEAILDEARALGFEPVHRAPLPLPASDGISRSSGIGPISVVTQV